MAAMKKDELSGALDAMFMRLIKEAEPVINDGAVQSEDGTAPIGFLDRLRLFSEGVRWASVKAKVETEDVSDEFGRLRAGHIGGTRRRGGASATPARPNGAS